MRRTWQPASPSACQKVTNLSIVWQESCIGATYYTRCQKARQLVCVISDCKQSATCTMGKVGYSRNPRDTYLRTLVRFPSPKNIPSGTKYGNYVSTVRTRYQPVQGMEMSTVCIYACTLYSAQDILEYESGNDRAPYSGHTTQIFIWVVEDENFSSYTSRDMRTSTYICYA